MKTEFKKTMAHMVGRPNAPLTDGELLGIAEIFAAGWFLCCHRQKDEILLRAALIEANPILRATESRSAASGGEPTEPLDDSWKWWLDAKIMAEVETEEKTTPR